jgi:negative regulator of PHO system
MISGVPLFRGRDNNDQLNQILRIIGTPDEATLRRIASESPEIHLRPFPRMQRIPFSSLYPKAHPVALDLMDKLLQFDPARRIDCQSALFHPYFGSSQSAQPQGQQQRQA